MQNHHLKEQLYKILVIGDLGVGKTSIIKRYVQQKFSLNYRGDYTMDFALKVLNLEQMTVRLQLWDIAEINIDKAERPETISSQQESSRGGTCSVCYTS